MARGGGSKGGAKMAHIRVYHEVLEVCPKENAAHMCPWMQLTGMRSMRGWETRTMLSGGKKGVGFYCKNTISVRAFIPRARHLARHDCRPCKEGESMEKVGQRARKRCETRISPVVHTEATRREGTQFPPNPYPERGYPIPPTHLPGEGVPNLLRLPTRREGTLSSLATSLLLSPPPSPLRHWQRPFPFPFSKPLTSAKKNQNPRAAPQ